jgi:hypothetical protein
MTIRDSDKVKLAVAAGAVIDTDTAPYRDRVAAEFVRNLKDYENLSQTSEGYLYLGYDKLSESLIKELVDHELAYVSVSESLPSSYLLWYDADEPFVVLPEKLAVVYMTLLAREIGAAIGAPVITDRPQFASLGQQLLAKTEIVGNLDERSSRVLQELLVDFVSIESIQKTPLETILAIRNRRTDEMRKFRLDIEDTVTLLANCVDPSQFDDVVNEARRRLANSVNEQKLVFRDYGLEFVERVLSVASPALVATMLAELASNNWLSYIAGLVTIGGAIRLTTARYDLKRARQASTSSYQYLLTLPNELAQ